MKFLINILSLSNEKKVGNEFYCTKKFNICKYQKNLFVLKITRKNFIIINIK